MDDNVAMPADRGDTRPLTFEDRVQVARDAVLALYLADPGRTTAQGIQAFEDTVDMLRRERKAAQKD